jgi:hypothetical protein
METNHKKILVLRIYNSSPEYDEMRKLHMKYDNSLSIVYDDSLDKDWSIDFNEKMIKIKGTESIIPGVLDKTIKAIEICIQNFDFDILVRSNMSTVIDTKELSDQLNNISAPIYGGHLWNLHWCHIDYNITEEFLKLNNGLKYISGTSIVLSRDMCEYIISHKSELDRNIIDDIAIGLILKNKEYNNFTSQLKENVSDLVENTCFYRCKNMITSMQKIYERLIESGRTCNNILYKISNGN